MADAFHMYQIWMFVYLFCKFGLLFMIISGAVIKSMWQKIRMYIEYCSVYSLDDCIFGFWLGLGLYQYSNSTIQTSEASRFSTAAMATLASSW